MRIKATHTTLSLLLTGTLLLCLGSAVAWGQPGEPVAPEKAQAALKTSVRALDLQTEFPTARPRPMMAVEPPSWSLPPELVQIIFWTALAVVVAVILLNLRDNFWSDSRARPLTAEEEEAAAGPQAAAARLNQARLEADELARQGRFVEAMHVLLLQSLSEFRRRLGLSIAASLTSREILAQIGLAPEGRRAFADIIGRVEVSWFGARQAGPEDFAACRRSYEVLSGALSGGHLS